MIIESAVAGLAVARLRPHRQTVQVLQNADDAVFQFRLVRPAALVADAVRGQLKPNRPDAHLVGKTGAIQREPQIVREPQEVGERAL